ncbi:MAG: YfhO family protein [Firmicutes bacterium]|nr:YfhO family protein [Bacillota bacterium]
MRITNLNDKPLKFRVLTLYYTILFAVIALGVFSVFILLGKSFIQHGDGFRQGYFWTAEIKHIIESVMSGNGLPQWNWSRGLGMQYLYRLDPFNLFAALFPMSKLELGITLSLLLKLYFGGLAFLYFLFEMKLSNFKCLAGTICYIFSTWFINVTMIQSSFIFISFMFPLVFLSIDWIYRGKSPVLFIVTVAYFLIRDTYLAYMAAIVAILFMLLRYFAYHDDFKIKEYLGTIGKFVIYGLIAGMISAMFCIQFILATMRASTDSSSAGPLDLVNDVHFFIRYGKMLLTWGLTTGYTYFGIPIFALMALPIAFKKFSLKNTSVLMTAILILMTFFPFFSRMFNGFSYGTGRWYVMLVFFAIWASAEVLDVEELRNKKNLIVMFIWLVILAVWTLGFDFINITGLSNRGALFITLNLMAGLALLIVIGFKNDKIKVIYRQIACFVIIGCTLALNWSVSFYLYQNKFIDIGEVDDQLSKSCQRVNPMLEDDGFYRTDQVDWINFHHGMEMPVSENLWWQSKSIYVYDSFTSSKQLEFNKALGNNYGYLMRVYLISNDNRMGLDFLYGVKYFMGDDAKAGITGSDAYAGYGFSYMDTIDGVNVYKNKYDPGLGFAYDKFMSESEFMKLTKHEREQALLQAAVVPDDMVSEISENITQVTAADIETDTKNVPFEIIDQDGLEFKDGKIITSKEHSTFTVKVNPVHDCQLIVSFDGLIKTNDKSFSVTCNDGRLEEVIHTGHSNQCIPGIKDFDMNMGYYENFDGTLTFDINHEGEYELGDMYITAMSVDNYDKYAQQRMLEKYEIAEYDDKHVSGTVNATDDGIIYFSIPQYTNWDVYIDGEKVDKIENLNMAFLGVQVTKGQHDVELKYNNVSLKLGIIATIIGIILTILIAIQHRRRKKNFADYMNLPVDKSAVFLEARNGKEIDGNVFYMAKELLTNDKYKDFNIKVSAEDEKTAAVIRQKLDAMPRKPEILIVDTDKYYRALSTAKYIICDASLKNFFIKKNKQIYLNLWHGTPFKVMGRKVKHEPHATGNVQKNFVIADYLLYPNEYMMEHMVNDYMLENASSAKIILSGYPRNSAFFDDERREEIIKEQGLEGKKIYVYMPTHRPALMGQTLVNVLKQMDDSLSEGEVLFAKVHPLAADQVDYSQFKNIKAFPKTYETYEFLNAADCLITDYSSVFYDYAVTGRKIVLYTYDADDYLSTRGLYSPIDTLPFPQVKTAAEAIKEARSPKNYDDSEFIKKYCNYDSKDAASSLCERVFFGTPCGKEYDMPSNGKPNVMIYAAKGADISALVKDLDPDEANYFLVFNKNDMKDDLKSLLDLPEGISYFPRAGKMQTAGKKPADWILEWKRCFGNMKVDKIIGLPDQPQTPLEKLLKKH